MLVRSFVTTKARDKRLVSKTGMLIYRDASGIMGKLGE